jgi:gluconate 2-dehydrogenase gamma chain
MPDDVLTRRMFLTASCALASAAVLADPELLRASLRHARRGTSQTSGMAFEFFTSTQAADIEAIAAQIFPTDETPGAREAGVVYFIDHSLSTWAKGQQPLIIQGLDDLAGRVGRSWPDANRFSALTFSQQTSLLQEIDTTPFFQALRFSTILGMFSLPSYGGNANKVGWELIGFDNRQAWDPPFGAYDAEG